MARFQSKEKQHRYRRPLLSVALFAGIIGIFFYGTTSLTKGSTRRQRESLENALNRSITYCYAVEGTYPESLDYIREHYGLTYDEEAFYVDYHVSASNIYPDYTIIELGE